MSTAVVTFTFNESVNLPIWIKYYGSNFGEDNLFIADRGSNDGSIENIGKANLLRLPRNEFDEFQKTDFISNFHRSLLNFYTTVIITDTDELVVADPAHFNNLADYLDKSDFKYVSSIGLEVIHILNREDPLDLTLPVLSQRRYARFQSPSCKILISRVPIVWRPGFHSCDKVPRFDQNLFMFHTKTMDYNIAMGRQKINRETIWSQRSLGQNLGAHHRFSNEEFVKASFLVPMDQVNRGIVSDFNFETETARFTAETTSTNGNFLVPMNLPKKVVGIPERFKNVF